MTNSAGRNVPGVLYVVATPIGNLEDVSARAVRILGEVDVIACEDTRHSARLLSAHSIRTPTISYFEHNEQHRTPALIERLARGENVALITDAGTPAISDPGYRLVSAAIAAGIRVAAVPGPSAAVAAISISGLPTDRFTFEGFLPQRAGARRNAIAALKREPRTMVFFEAARRLAATLEDMATALGASREAAVVREITKTFEESVRGTLGELHARFAATEPRGEIVLVVAGATASATAGVADASGEAIMVEAAGGVAITVEALCDAGLSLKDASAAVARLTGTSRREIYQQTLARRGSTTK
ncbi:MAG TPA: 16S rRNA (cytidine(1402)-2'-O)-methyltransferase [Candidatus Binataceae bacterium]